MGSKGKFAYIEGLGEIEALKLGTLIRQYRLTQGWTQSWLAVRLSTSRSTISRWERGVSVPDAYTIKELKRLIGDDFPKLLSEVPEFDSPFPNDEDYISNYIEFPPEHFQAGMTILSYFGTILHQKYPDTRASVRIEQNGEKVRLIVIFPSGERDIVEKTLTDYGLVISGKMKIEEFFTDRSHQLQLENKLEIANVELRSAQRLLHFQQYNYEKRIESLEEQVHFLREHVGNSLITLPDVNQLVEVIGLISTRMEKESSKTLRLALRAIRDGIKSDFQNIEQDLPEALQTVKEKDPRLFDTIKDFAIKATSSASGRVLYDVMTNLP